MKLTRTEKALDVLGRVEGLIHDYQGDPSSEYLLDMAVELVRDLKRDFIIRS